MSEKIALQVTYYKHNFGSVLQAYATKEFLDAHGIKAIVVEEKLTYIERILFGMKRRIRYMWQAILFPSIRTEKMAQMQASQSSIQSINPDADKKIESFIEKSLNRMELSYHEMRRMARKHECIFCLAGSDQIWNGSKVFLNPIYFLTFSPKKKRVALAPSFGNNEISEFNEFSYNRLISKFEKVSVREKESLSLINKMGKRGGYWILDPVLLLSAEDWLKISDEEESTQQYEYVFAFFLNSPNEKAVKSLESYARMNYKIVTLGYEKNMVNVSDRLKIDVRKGGPEKFLELIRKAAVVCTDSFHATVFSLIFHRPFYTFERCYINSKQSARLLDFLKCIDMLDRYENEMCTLGEMEVIRYKIFDKLVESNRLKVIEYLEL